MSEQDEDTRSLAELLSPLVDLLLGAASVEDTNQAIVDIAVSVIPGCDHASFSTLAGGRFRTVSASDGIAARIDELERETGQGPCLDAITDAAFQHDPDITRDPTWPELAARALAETPVRAMLAFRLVDDGRKGGALNLFSDTAGAFDAVAVDEATIIASFAGVVLVAAGERARAEDLERALQSNREIGKAIGLLMAAHGLSDAEAFDVLRRASQSLNRKLHDIASEFVAKQTSTARE